MIAYLPALLFAFLCCVLMLGYPVAFSLAGSALIFAYIGAWFGVIDASFLWLLPNRLFGILNNQTLLAVPLFVYMGVMLEKSQLAEQLLAAMNHLLKRVNGGLGMAVVLVGMLLAASTGIVGATVVTLAVLALPGMLNRGYGPARAAGIVAATGTLGQILPPSIALVLLGDMLSSAYQQAQLKLGVFSPKTVSVGELFAGALVPGLILVLLYLAYVLFVPCKQEAQEDLEQQETDKVLDLATGAALGWLLFRALVPTLSLIFVVLGSILFGFATPTEAAAVGAFGATVLAAVQGRLNLHTLREVGRSSLHVTSMVFMILIGAALFSLVFYALGGETLVHQWFHSLPGGPIAAMAVVMLLIFLLGFILDFIEITFVVVPIVGPVLLAMGIDPVWLGVMIAVNLQTSFLTPPFGFALFYLRGAAPDSIKTADIYRGVVPFIGLQLLMLLLLACWPALATWLPSVLYS
ncbi:TRAP transporter large permease subunit [Corallincola luteus]|uniref:TRAP transporter large permease protein n=1 Tax=Corallincola luteus TaxID=1775177 RepID=A0ABY2APW5_9GAMM|nr:TRAP transporter large permease subunit [Corallincola luteus]